MKPSSNILLPIIISLAASCASAVETNKRSERVQDQAPRFHPLAESQWSETQRKVLAPLEVNGKVINVLSTAARNPEMLDAWLPFGM